MPNFAAMKRFAPIEDQEYLYFSGDDLIIVDQIQNLPENGVYYSEHVFIIICTEGRMEMTYDGRRQSLKKGELFIGVPGCVLSDYMLSPHFDCKIVAIKPSEATVPVELQKQMVRSALYIKDHSVRQLIEEEWTTFFSYYELLCQRIHKSSHRYYKGEVRALLNSFLLFVVGTMDHSEQDTEPTTTIHGEHLVESFIRMVNDDCGHHRLVEYYAERLNISAKYLSTLVRNTLDRTPTEIIKIVAMKEIERRLRHSNQSIKEISNDLNFPNTSFFGKYFKKYAGMTPNSFRTKYQQ